VHLPAIAIALWLDAPTVVSACLGLPAVVAGMGLRTWALGFICKDQALCTAGPYALVRHPLYLGNLVILAGLLALAASPLLAAIAIPIAAFHYYTVIRQEESWLASRFRQEWMAYRARVPALIPRLAIPPGGFSWQRAWSNAVGLNWLLLAGVVGLLLVKPWVAALLHRAAH